MRVYSVITLTGKMLSIVGPKFTILLFSFLYFNVPVATQDVDSILTIPLNKTITYENRELYGEFITLNRSTTLQVNFSDIGANLTFIVFQVHSQFHNVALYKNNLTNITQVYGTNVGHIGVLKMSPNEEPKADIFYIQNPKQNFTFPVYISVHGYVAGDPYPGGCNMEFPVPLAPFLEVTTNTAYITVAAAPASIDPECGVVNMARVSFYMMYLPETSYSEDDYFKGIKKMMTLEGIQNEGMEIPMTVETWLMRRMLSAYPGTGVIFVAVARSLEVNTGYSVYVPDHSYGCPKVDEDGCASSDDLFSQMLCAALLFIGMFISSLGHRFFKTEMFLAGFFSGFIITYILISLIESTEIDTPALVAASALSGVFFGAIWLLFWWLYGIPVVAVLLPSLNLGFLFSAVLYHKLPASVFYLENDFNFWSLFIVVMLLTALALVSFTYSANILCCAVLGAFATSFALDHFTGSNIKFIMINTVRRAVVPNFNKAVLAPPSQWRDTVVIITWIGVATVGWSLQHWYNRGRPPFPPPPRSTRLAAPEPTNYGAVTEYTRRQVRHITTIRHHLTDSPVVSRTYSERTYLLSDT